MTGGNKQHRNGRAGEMCVCVCCVACVCGVWRVCVVCVVLRENVTYNYNCAVSFKLLYISGCLRKSEFQMLDSTLTK